MTEDGYVRGVFEESSRRLVTQLYAVTGDFVDAEDAVQEAFARALAAGPQWQSTGNPEAWLRTVSVNIVRTKWRRSSLFSTLSSRISTPSVVPGVSEDHVALIAALRRLPSVQREVLAMHYFGDLSVLEIAETLGVPDGTVKSRLKRGRAALHVLLSTEAAAS